MAGNWKTKCLIRLSKSLQALKQYGSRTRAGELTDDIAVMTTANVRKVVAA